jgi:ribosomal protein L11 methyltransferase
MPLLQLSLDAGDLDPELISEWLSEAGALAVTLEDAADEPILEPPLGTTPLWSRTRVIGLFEGRVDAEAIRAALGVAMGAAAGARLRIEPLEDRDWTRAWMDDFHPMRFGERLWVVPGNHAPPCPDAVNLLLDPGLAFGTGTHPTTALCLEWLDRHPPHDQTLIDYGCGSGILAVAALKLGARKVWAVDNDPQALIATQSNAVRNAVAANLHVFMPDDLPAVRADVLVANILANPLIELQPRFVALLQAQGRIVLSGILATQAAQVCAAYATDFDLDPAVQRNEWVRIAGERKREGERLNTEYRIQNTEDRRQETGDRRQE